MSFIAWQGYYLDLWCLHVRGWHSFSTHVRRWRSIPLDILLTVPAKIPVHVLPSRRSPLAGMPVGWGRRTKLSGRGWLHGTGWGTLRPWELRRWSHGRLEHLIGGNPDGWGWHARRGRWWVSVGVRHPLGIPLLGVWTWRWGVAWMGVAMGCVTLRRLIGHLRDRLWTTLLVMGLGCWRRFLLRIVRGLLGICVRRVLPLDTFRCILVLGVATTGRLLGRFSTTTLTSMAWPVLYLEGD